MPIQPMGCKHHAVCGRCKAFKSLEEKKAIDVLPSVVAQPYAVHVHTRPLHLASIQILRTRHKSILWVGISTRPRTQLEDTHVRVPVSLVCSCVVHLFFRCVRLGRARAGGVSALITLAVNAHGCTLPKLSLLYGIASVQRTTVCSSARDPFEGERFVVRLNMVGRLTPALPFFRRATFIAKNRCRLTV